MTASPTDDLASAERRIQELTKELAQSRGELVEAREQQAATGGILSVISSSPKNLQSVLAEIAASAARLCDAYDASIFQVNGDVLRLVANHGSIPPDDTLPLTPEVVVGRAVLDGRTIQIADLRVETGEYRVGSDRARFLGYRTILAVPLIRAGEAIGVIAVRRTEARPFTDKQIALLETFADQAVIAIENTRLFNETQEALARQTASADILRVISQSPTDVTPVFDTIVAAAVRLLAVDAAFVQLTDGKTASPVAGATPSGRIDKFRPGFPVDPTHNFPSRAIVSKSTVQLPDWSTLSLPPHEQAVHEAIGVEGAMYVPLLQGDVCLGVLSFICNQARAFTAKEIALAESFRDQAVIAIENARLFEAEQASKRELQESLEYQTATADVLNVISRSPNALQPVLNAIIATAGRLCEADYAHCRLERNGQYHVMARHALNPDEVESVPGLPVVADRSSVTGKVVTECRTIHVPDVLADPEDTYAVNVGLPARTILGVPLIRNGKAIGVIVLFRRSVRPFTQRQIDLVTTFADQAVIAIENTRLFEQVQARTKELQESLDRQTATSEVLGVISRSPNEVQPVLDTIVATAQRLCQADRAIVWRLVGGTFCAVAHIGQPEERVESLLSARRPLSRGSMVGRATLARRAVQVEDVATDPELVAAHAFSRAGNIHTILAVPLLFKEEPIGAITLGRTRVAPFDDKQVALVEAFADQAVIAIENTRLFEAEQARTREVEVKSTELAQSLEYQTAISEVLGVISRSPSDVQQVFDVIVKRAAHLFPCYATVVTLEDGQLHWKATASAAIRRSENDVETIKALYPLPFDPDHSPSCRAILERRIIEIPDVATPDTPQSTRKALQIGGYRSATFVPLMREGKGIGAIALAHPEPGFKLTDTQLVLAQTFADQAVIAIENTRLFEAEKASKRELQQSLEYQTATSDVLRVISNSPTDIKPVLRAICETASRICEAQDATVFLRDGGQLKFGAHHGSIPNVDNLPISRDLVTGRAVLDRRPVHVHDLADAAIEFPLAHEMAGRMGHRTILTVPLMREDVAIGVIGIRRTEVKPFTDRQIDLLKTFADQAVIAIENTRLFEAEQASKRELQEALEYQTATSEVLKVISRSAFELQLVIDTLVESAARLCDGDAWLFRRHGDAYRWAASHGFSPEHHERIKAYMKRRTFVPNRGMTSMRAALEGRVVHIMDVLDDPEYTESEIQKIGGFRTTLGVPLLRDEFTIGVLALTRPEVRPFTDNQIELITTFADQAVIAIENARLFEEVQARTLELAKTVEDLEIASQHKNQFVANMSHELRTPLAAILGYAELIQEGFYEPQGPKSLEALSRIRSNGKHLLGLINTVLDIAKIDSGQFTLNMSEYAMETVVETVRAATESLAQNKKLTLTTSVDRPLPVGLGDEQRLTQVLLNLVGNAIKFTDAGEVSIAAGARTDHFAISVTDTGPGIPLDQQGRIFEQFHQVDGSLTKAKGGTGLGLAIAKQIVEMHGGRIWVESTPGKGSTFQMELPTRAEFRKLASPSG